MLHWIVQNNLYNEPGYDVLLETIERFKLQHTYVKVVPFSHDLVSPETHEGISLPTPDSTHVIVMGSITLSKVARRMGWLPGAFTNDNFDYRVWSEALRPHVLNADSTVCRFADAEWHKRESMFIRPCLDDKSFAGHVLSGKQFNDWRQRVIELKETYTTLDGDTMVCFGRPREIYQECRFFVVDGSVVTGSQYKLGTRVVPSADVSPVIWDFAQSMVDLWQPDRAFAIDIADTPDGPKVIEIGCLNSCGFYATNVQQLVLTLDSMEDFS